MKPSDMKTGLLLFMFTFFFHTLTINAQKIDYGNNSAAGRYLPIRGIQYYLETYGSGSPLVLLHGNGGSIASMSPIIPYFSERYKVIAIDSRAQGKTIDTKDSLSFEMIADDVAAILDSLQISKADFVGWSDGGIVALDMGIRHSDKVYSIAATGANVSPDSSAFVAGVWNADKHYYEAKKNKKRRSIKKKNNWKLFMLDWSQPNISVKQLQQILAPCLIICGDRDVISLEHTISIYRNIPNGQLWVVPNSGHGTFIEHPKEFYETVDKFIMTPL